MSSNEANKKQAKKRENEWKKEVQAYFRSIEMRLYQAELLNSISLNSTLLFNKIKTRIHNSSR